MIAVRRSFLEKNRETVKRFLKAYSEAVCEFNNDKKLGIATYAKWLKEENTKVNEETYDYFRTLLSFPPRAVRGQGFRTGIQMIAQRLGRGTTDINLEQFLDESLLDELEKEGFYKLITKWEQNSILFLTHSAKQVDNQACRERVGSLFLTEFKVWRDVKLPAGTTSQ